MLVKLIGTVDSETLVQSLHVTDYIAMFGLQYRALCVSKAHGITVIDNTDNMYISRHAKHQIYIYIKFNKSITWLTSQHIHINIHMIVIVFNDDNQ